MAARMEGSLEGALRRTGRYDEVHDFGMARRERVTEMVLHAIQTGHLDAEADRLEAVGRIDIAPQTRI